MNVSKINVNIGSKIFKNWIAENKTGNRIDKNDPKNGIKFRKNERMPKAGAKSFLRKSKIIKVSIPVKILVRVLSWK